MDGIKQVGVTAGKERVAIGTEVWLKHPACGKVAGMRGTLDSYDSEHHCTILFLGANRHTSKIPISFITDQRPW